jgi:hypothetical protein
MIESAVLDGSLRTLLAREALRFARFKSHF